MARSYRHDGSETFVTADGALDGEDAPWVFLLPRVHPVETLFRPYLPLLDRRRSVSEGPRSRRTRTLLIQNASRIHVRRQRRRPCRWSRACQLSQARIWRRVCAFGSRVSVSPWTAQCGRTVASSAAWFTMSTCTSGSINGQAHRSSQRTMRAFGSTGCHVTSTH